MILLYLELKCVGNTCYKSRSYMILLHNLHDILTLRPILIICFTNTNVLIPTCVFHFLPIDPALVYSLRLNSEKSSNSINSNLESFN